MSEQPSYGYAVCPYTWGDHPWWNHECGLSESHDGPHRCNHCQEER